MQTSSFTTASSTQGQRITVGAAIGKGWSTSTVLDAKTRARLLERVELVDLDLSGLPEPAPAVEALITGWGTPRLDAHLLDLLPGLRVVLHAAGSVRGIVSPDLWARGIRVTSAAGVNAVPVVEFTVAQIGLALKNAWRLAAQTKSEASVAPQDAVPGVYSGVVGLVGLGRIGRMVTARLQAMGVTVLAYDPHVSGSEAARMGLEMLPLTELATRSEVLSVHAPLIDTTVGMIGSDVLERLPAGATLINTARGAVIDTAELTQFLRRRTDVYALLDVTDPEPLPADHPLLTMPNTFITPHIAGSLGREVALLGQHAAEQLNAYLDSGQLSDEVFQQDMTTTA